MRKLGIGILTVVSAVALWAPGALAATPEDIYNDLADNGKIDGTYTQAEMQAFLQSASVQGYGNPVVVVVPPTITPTVLPPTVVTTPPAATPPAAVTPPAAAPAAVPAPASGVAGTSKTVVNAKPKAKPVAQVAGVATPVQAPLARTASAETLPFTGAELAMFAIVGAALLLGGFVLRASARKR